MLGALQWPSTQTAPQLGATVSLLSGQITAATTEDLHDASKPEFFQVNNDVGLQFLPLGQISDVVLEFNVKATAESTQTKALRLTL